MRHLSALGGSGDAYDGACDSRGVEMCEVDAGGREAMKVEMRCFESSYFGHSEFSRGLSALRFAYLLYYTECSLRENMTGSEIRTLHPFTMGTWR